MSKPETLREAAVEVITAIGPAHYEAIIKEVLARYPDISTSETPGASLNAMMAVDIKRRGSGSQFIRVGPGTFGLRSLHGGTTAATSTVQAPSPVENPVDEGAISEDQRRVRIPLFPNYGEVRQLLQIWPGRLRKQVTGLQATIGGLRGTPQETVDWSDPGAWIPERLQGEDRKLAETIWQKSGGEVNPRHIYGHWLLSQKYELIEEDAGGVLHLTARGEDFLKQPGGDAEAYLDEQEGLAKLLALVAENGPTRAGGLLAEWAEYLKRCSLFGSDSTIRDTLQRRLRNLLERNLIERKGTLYSITEIGLSHLQKVGTEESLGGNEQQALWNLVAKQNASVSESLLEILLDMDPYAFEHLIKRLLEAMDYQNVKVTSASGDGGVDVIADIELGISSVREVVQAKRHRRTIQRHTLDALRGSLHRFNAVRGTIITTARFAKGTKEAAFTAGAAPITLIDGERLVELLIEYGIGVRKRTLEVLEVDPEPFAQCEADGARENAS